MIRRKREERGRGREDSAALSPRLPPTSPHPTALPPPSVVPPPPLSGPLPLPSPPSSADPSDGRPLPSKRKGGSRTHRRTLARQIAFKEISEEADGKGGKKRGGGEEEKERERGGPSPFTFPASAAPSAVIPTASSASSLGSPLFTQQVKPVTHHGQWKSSVVVGDGEGSSSDESEDDGEVEERERRRAEADREKEKEMRLHGLLPPIKAPSKKSSAPQLPSVTSPSPPPPPPSSGSSTVGSSVTATPTAGASDYSGFHKKALKWQKRVKKEKDQRPPHPSTSVITTPSSHPSQSHAQTSVEAEGREGKEAEGSSESLAPVKAKKGKKKAEGGQVVKRVGAWKSPAQPTQDVDLQMHITTLTQPKEQMAPSAIPPVQSGLSTAQVSAEVMRASTEVEALRGVDAGKANPTVAVPPSPSISEEERRWTESMSGALSARRLLLTEGGVSTTSPADSPNHSGASSTTTTALLLGSKAFALLSSSSSSLSSSLTSSLTSSLAKALQSSGASLIAQADMEMKKQRKSPSHSPLLPSSPIHLPRLPTSTSSSRPSSRKQRRVEAAFSLDPQEDVEEMAFHTAVLPLGPPLLAEGEKTSLATGQELRMESWGEDEDGEGVREETVLSLKTIAMPFSHAIPTTATVLSNYLHDLSQASSSSFPPSLPPPPLSVHRLVSNSSQSASSPSSHPSDASDSYEPSPEAVLSYAQCLGMDLPFDSDLLWIPRMALLHPLPEPWRCCESDGCIYFVKWDTGECSFTDPSDEFYFSLYRREKEHKWGEVIERLMEDSGVRRDAALDLSSQRLDDVGMEVLSDMILGMGEMEDEKDEKRRERRKQRRNRRRIIANSSLRSSQTPQTPTSGKALGEGEDGVDVEEEEVTLPGYNIGILLTSLNLSHNRIASQGCDTLLSSLSLSLHAPLSSLNLSSNELTSDCCLSLSRYLSHNPFLLSLDLSNNESIGNMGAEHLARSLTAASSLRWLSLAKSGINDFGCGYLCAGLIGHSALSVLDVSDNDIGERGWKEIGRLLMTAPTLWEVRANGLREAKGEDLRCYAGEGSAEAEKGQGRRGTTSSSSPSPAPPPLTAEAALVRAEVLLCMDTNTQAVLSKRRTQQAVLAGLSQRCGDGSTLRRYFAVEAWAEKEEEEEEMGGGAGRFGAGGGNGGRRSIVRSQKKDSRRTSVKARRTADGRTTSSASPHAGERKKGKKGTKSGKGEAAEGATDGVGDSSGYVMMGDGVRVRIGSVGIARQQGLADNALRQVWAFL